MTRFRRVAGATEAVHRSRASVRSPPRSCGSTTSTSSSTGGSSSCSAARPPSPSSASSPRSGRSTARYKHSKPVLKTFPTTGPQVVQGPGENAGVLRLPDGWAVAFKIESHNHPSAVEPYQGAATGVGGILRDVFTMGARPVAVLNSLRFGPLDVPRNRYLFAGVVRGVGDYGNCVGIPTLGGEVGFAPGYTGNPLVNAMCVGLLRGDRSDPRRGRTASATSCSASAPAPGATASTAPASPRRSCREKSEARRPAGPGGRSLHREAAARGEPGADHLGAHRRHPGHGRGRAHQLVAPRWRRAAASGSRSTPAWCRPAKPGMTPYEILLSESQERMLVVAEPSRVAEVQAVCAKWELTATADRPGHRRRHLPGPAPRADGGRHSGAAAGRRLPDLPSGGPREARRPAPASRAIRRRAAERRSRGRARAAARHAHHREQALGVRAVRLHGAGLDRARPGRRRRRAPGAGHAVRPRRDAWTATPGWSRSIPTRAARPPWPRRRATSPARAPGRWASPTASTSATRRSPRSSSSSARRAGASPTPAARSARRSPAATSPSTTRAPRGAVDPTPTVGMVGLLERGGRPGAEPLSTRRATRSFILGATQGELGGSAYWAEVCDFVGGVPARWISTPSVRLQRFLVAAAQRRLLRSAHDCSEGGLARGAGRSGDRRALCAGQRSAPAST